MDKLISILPPVNGHFIAQQQGQTFGWLPEILIAVGLISIIVALRSRSWIFGLSSSVLIVLAVTLYFANRGIIYRMDISPGDALQYQAIKNGKAVGNSNVYLENIVSADLEYQRQNSRIVAVMRDGRKLYPLGEDWVNNEPLQFQVLNAIREAIGQIPAPAPPQ